MCTHLTACVHRLNVLSRSSHLQQRARVRLPQQTWHTHCPEQRCAGVRACTRRSALRDVCTLLLQRLRMLVEFSQSNCLFKTESGVCRTPVGEWHAMCAWLEAPPATISMHPRAASRVDSSPRRSLLHALHSPSCTSRKRPTRMSGEPQQALLFVPTYIQANAYAFHNA